MISKHEELKKLQEASVSIEKHCLQLEEQLEDKKQKNARVEDKVQSIKQKKSLHEKVSFSSEIKHFSFDFRIVTLCNSCCSLHC